MYKLPTVNKVKRPSHKVLYGSLIGLLLLVVVVLFGQKAIATHNAIRAVNSAENTAIRQANVTNADKMNASKASCLPSDFDTICSAELVISRPSDQRSDQVEATIIGVESRLRRLGWTESKIYRPLDKPHTIYVELSKKYGDASCEVTLNNTSFNPAADSRASFTESIACNTRPVIYLPFGG